MSDFNIFLLTALVCLTLGLITFSLNIRKSKDLLQPSLFFAAYLCMGYLFPLRSFLEGTDIFSRIWPYAHNNFDRAMTDALISLNLAVIGYSTGYFIAYRNSLRKKMFNNFTSQPFNLTTKKRLFRISFVLVFIGLLGFVFSIVVLGGFSTLFSGLGDRTRLSEGINYLFLAGNLLLSVVIVWWTLLLLTRKKITMQFWMFAVFAGGLVGLQGSKSVIFVYVVALVLIYHRLKKQISMSLLVCGGVLLFASLTLYSRITREFLVVGQFVTLDLSDPLTFIRTIELELGGNLMQLQVLTIIVDGVNSGELRLQYGSSYLSLLTLPIPRALYQDKPLPSTGIFTLAFWPNRWLLQGTTLPPGIVGEMFLNFGFLGVLLGNFIFGYVQSRIYFQSLSPPYSIKNTVLCALMTSLTFHYLRGEFVAPTTLLLILYLPVLAIVRYIDSKPTPPMRNNHNYVVPVKPANYDTLQKGQR
jgi:hypothetical protein